MLAVSGFSRPGRAVEADAALRLGHEVAQARNERPTDGPITDEADPQPFRPIHQAARKFSVKLDLLVSGRSGHATSELDAYLFAFASSYSSIRTAMSAGSVSPPSARVLPAGHPFKMFTCTIVQRGSSHCR